MARRKEPEAKDAGKKLAGASKKKRKEREDEAPVPTPAANDGLSGWEEVDALEEPHEGNGEHASMESRAWRACEPPF